MEGYRGVARHDGTPPGALAAAFVAACGIAEGTDRAKSVVSDHAQAVLTLGLMFGHAHFTQ